MADKNNPVKTNNEIIYDSIVESRKSQHNIGAKLDDTKISNEEIVRNAKFKKYSSIL